VLAVFELVFVESLVSKLVHFFQFTCLPNSDRDDFIGELENPRSIWLLSEDRWSEIVCQLSKGFLITAISRTPGCQYNLVVLKDVFEVDLNDYV